ncbi:phosphatase PAP2 family protein [Rurimicrobium arvi]|uniref:Phosphatidic acid phosphatase type 2/haloperoxidase domain-containing protein n=1 Tax=Rurimicrobium arvi TaxID=2049916 RepID=A0ABP8N295_9BACT
MTRKPFIGSFNLFYLVPFCIWSLLGGVLLYHYKASQLFFWINTHNSPQADVLFEWCSRMGEFWGILVIALLLIISFRPFRNIWFAIAVLAGTIIPSLITQWVKHLVAAPRPMSLFAQVPYLHRLETWDLLHSNSFPSGHTTGAFSFFLIVSLWLPPRYRAWGLAAFVLALATAYARVYLTAHFFADVYAGSLIGTLFAILIFELLTWCRYRFHGNATAEK